jgi:predicted metal-dependent phosphoesterase TrpH
VNTWNEQDRRLIHADLHVHTEYSNDSATTLEQVIEQCIHTGINCVAIADHGTIKGAQKLKSIAPFFVIIAEEIMTPYGEVMGLFLEEEIPNHISLEETVKHIKGQGGLLCIPHPFDRVRLSAFKGKGLKKIMPSVDIVEVYNSRSLTPGNELRAVQLADSYGTLRSAGSDAHTPSEIGHAYVKMKDFGTKSEFLESLRHGQIIGRKSSPLVHLASTVNKFKHNNV